MMVANPAYYLDDYVDEIMPSNLSECTLEGWAKWLSEGGEPADEDGETGCWTIDPPKDGETFSASVLTFLDDIEIERLPDDEEECEARFKWSRPLDDGIDFAAIRFGPGMGWSPEDILCETSQTGIETEIADPAWPKMEVGDTALLAVARNRDVRLTYHADPPRLVEQSIQ